MSAFPTALVIVGGDDIHHDLIAGSLSFQATGLAAGFRTRRAVGLQRFIDGKPFTLDNDIFVIYSSGAAFSPDEQIALTRLVESGAGLVALHCSNVVPGPGASDYSVWTSLLGNRYLSHGPGPHESYQEISVTREHPAANGVSRSFRLWDEHYEIEFTGSGHEVIAERHRADGSLAPVMYVKTHGAGRVVYLALGHDARSWEEPMFKQLLTQSMSWAARR